MSEPTGDTPPNQPTAPTDPPVAQPVPLPPAPRANPPSVYNTREAAPAPPPSAPVGMNDFLAWIQALGGLPAAPPPPEANPAGQRTTLAKEQRKFHRQTAEATRAENMAGMADMSHAAGPSVARAPGEGLTVMRRRRPQLPRTAAAPPSYRFLLPWIFLIAILAGMFLLGRLTAPKSAVSLLPPTTRTPDHFELSTQNMALIDQAMAAEQRRDFSRASNLLQQVRADQNHVPGVDYHLALLAFESADLPRAMSLIDRSIEEGEEVAASYNLRGTMVNRRGGINRGLPALEAATQFDPFNAKYFFYLGEALRRDGKPQAALGALQQAVDRLRDPAQEGIYRLKVRLAQLELGREDDFAVGLKEQLQRPVPPIDWLFTAAALEMHRGHFDTAAGFLDRVMAQTDQQTANVRLRDYFFFGFAREKELTRFYASILKPEAAPAPEVDTFGQIDPQAALEVRDAPNAPASPIP